MEDDTPRRRRYRRESLALAELGAGLVGTALPRIEVRLPRHSADRAVAAWRSLDRHEGPLGDEDREQRRQRHRAGTLALIGLAVEERGRRVGDEVVVLLDAVLIVLAMEAADDESVRTVGTEQGARTPGGHAVRR
ncbi:hypothetical protein FHR81_001084 [Actinoalloteichus hoggarensis]|uniref:Uncharacterized protein n=1 Tax=Actinoalloteichus hoggarensis TaxID=1470176 RepID=A0A221VZA6_9PSEU|nr:hypothetical protein [Actinoalloteichus hoggarensis]ASO18820.1 hypothetical protein AHOG_05835 [Actinoalloteichus hoggarensis]MBB5920054.1 hypothetical protein [Actinoalloteichus hoggarensis]